jgi:ABC-2 type transport system permease protein
MNRLINSLARIKAIVFKEVKQLSRDRLTFGMIVMIPIIQLLLFGFAINTKLTNIPVGIVDHNQTSLSRYTQQAFVATQIVKIKKYYPTVRQAQQAITSGEVKAVLLIPKDLPSRFSQRRSYQKLKNQPQFANELRPIAQWIIDGTDPILANTIGGLSQMPLANIDLFFRNVNQVSPNFSVIKYFNPQGLSVINIVPGLVGIILTMTMIMFTSAAIVREKECGNHEFLITTPVKSMELMIGKILP